MKNEIEEESYFEKLKRERDEYKIEVEKMKGKVDYVVLQNMKLKQANELLEKDIERLNQSLNLLRMGIDNAVNDDQ